jgi:hypothetical protein
MPEMWNSAGPGFTKSSASGNGELCRNIRFGSAAVTEMGSAANWQNVSGSVRSHDRRSTVVVRGRHFADEVSFFAFVGTSAIHLAIEIWPK